MRPPEESVVGEVIANESDFQGAGLTTGTVNGEAVHGSDLSIRNDQSSGAEGLRIFTTGHRGDGQGDEFATTGFPEVQHIGVLDGVEGGGNGHLAENLGSFQVVDPLAKTIGVVAGGRSISDAGERSEVVGERRSLDVVLALR